MADDIQFHPLPTMEKLQQLCEQESQLQARIESMYEQGDEDLMRLRLERLKRLCGEGFAEEQRVKRVLAFARRRLRQNRATQL